MAKVIVFHYTDKGWFPPFSSAELTDLKKKLDSKLKNHPDLTFNGTFIDLNRSAPPTYIFHSKLLC